MNEPTVRVTQPNGTYYLGITAVSLQGLKTMPATVQNRRDPLDKCLGPVHWIQSIVEDSFGTQNAIDLEFLRAKLVFLEMKYTINPVLKWISEELEAGEGSYLG